MSRYSHNNKSPDDPGDDGHVFISATVNRSKALACTECKKPLPMRSRAVFELDSRERFVAVYCDNDECAPHDFADERHPFDLED